MKGNKPDTGGPAFPRPASENTTQGTLPEGNLPEDAQEGMSLRDYFAAAALAGGLEQGVENDLGGAFGGDKELWWHPPAKLARRAYAIADAMLAAREGGERR